MPAVIVSAQEATRTRICAAEACEMDAEPNHRLCFRCLRKDSVRIHTPPAIYTGDTLPCCTCHAFKPDAEFSIQRAHHAHHRRNRNSECKACSATRRRSYRSTWTPEQRQAERDRSARVRAKRRAQLGWPPA